MQGHRCLIRQLARAVLFLLSPPKLSSLWAPVPAQHSHTSWMCLMGLLAFPCLILRRCSVSIYYLCLYLRSSEAFLAQSSTWNSTQNSLYQRGLLGTLAKGNPTPTPSSSLLPWLWFSPFAFTTWHYILGVGESLFTVLLEYKPNKSKYSAFSLPLPPELMPSM